MLNPHGSSLCCSTVVLREITLQSIEEPAEEPTEEPTEELSEEPLKTYGCLYTQKIAEMHLANFMIFNKISKIFVEIKFRIFLLFQKSLNGSKTFRTQLNLSPPNLRTGNHFLRIRIFF